MEVTATIGEESDQSAARDADADMDARQARGSTGAWNIATARHSGPTAGTWTLLLMAILGVAVALKLSLVDHVYDAVGTALGGSFAFAFVFTMLVLRGGTVELTSERIRVTRRLGRTWQVALRNVTGVAFDADGKVTLSLHDGKTAAISRVAPATMGGAVWVAVHHRELLPAGARLDATPVDEARLGSRPAGRELWRNGAAHFADRGLVASVNDAHVYVPLTCTRAASGLNAVALIAGVVASRTLRLTYAPSPETLPLRNMISGILASPLSPAECLRRLDRLAAYHGGSRVTKGPGDTWHSGPIAGYDAHITMQGRSQRD